MNEGERQGGLIRVLVVDDHDLFRAGMSVAAVLPT